MKKNFGYGWKLSSESVKEALSHYDLTKLRTNKRDVLKDIKNARDFGDIPKNAKPQIFRVELKV